jgi:hypothetical protein
MAASNRSVSKNPPTGRNTSFAATRSYLLGTTDGDVVFGLVENTDAPVGRSVPKLALTLRETAQALSLSPVTVRRLNKRGLLRNVRAVRHLRFTPKEIERFLTESSQNIFQEKRRKK